MTKRGEGRQRALEQDDQLQKEGSKTPSRTGSLSLSIGQLATARMAIEPTDGHSRPGKRRPKTHRDHLRAFQPTATEWADYKIQNGSVHGYHIVNWTALNPSPGPLTVN
ncbi:hypothetical protein J3458_022576 [Metarhizium acridum]|uniref:uncharacterized protein n=1 Tax=Metarhizium acridum TaxID=92637 RepID=UPI001C6CCE2F|nr:hypothetical protein J3458_022576 [Metarhizium acridum]